MIEYLLGFDARIDRPDMWTAERKALYLLRSDIERPRSVDEDVWPRAGAIMGIIDRGSLPTNWDFRLIRDLNGLTEELEDTKESAGVTLIGITVLSESDLQPCFLPERSVQALSRFEGNSGYLLLGYDVADEWMVSGLMNCGYSPQQLHDLERFSSRLNRYHLFHDPAAALEFARLSEERVREHAPFYVYGIYVC